MRRQALRQAIPPAFEPIDFFLDRLLGKLQFLQRPHPALQALQPGIGQEPATLIGVSLDLLDLQRPLTQKMPVYVVENA